MLGNQGNYRGHQITKRADGWQVDDTPERFNTWQDATSAVFYLVLHGYSLRSAEKSQNLPPQTDEDSFGRYYDRRGN